MIAFGFGSGHYFVRGGQGDDFLLRGLCESAAGEQREPEGDTKDH